MSPPLDLNALLESFPFSRGLSEPSLERLGRELERRDARANTQLVCRGDEVGGIFLVLSGSIRVYYLHAEGREGTLYFVDPGEACFLSVHAALRNEPYAAWAEVDGDPVCFALLSTQLFRELLPREPALQDFALRVLSGRVSEMMQIVEATAVCSLEARLASLLLERSSADGRLAISQERLARHLGTAREVVVRLLRSLRAHGAVETERGAVRILDRGQLEALIRPDYGDRG